MHLDWDQLLQALELVGDGQYGLNPATGRLRFFDAHELQSDDPRELWDEARFIMVEPLPDWSVEEWVIGFAEEHGGASSGAILEAAHAANPRLAVRRALHSAPALEQAWHRYYLERMHDATEAWVSAHALEPGNPPPWRS